MQHARTELQQKDTKLSHDQVLLKQLLNLEIKKKRKSVKQSFQRKLDMRNVQTHRVAIEDECADHTIDACEQTEKSRSLKTTLSKLKNLEMEVTPAKSQNPY